MRKPARRSVHIRRKRDSRLPARRLRNCWRICVNPTFVMVVTLSIEDQLQRHGYEVGKVDGVIDAHTREAIRAYQADAGLAIDGEADDLLLAHLQTSDVQPLPRSATVAMPW